MKHLHISIHPLAAAGLFLLLFAAKKEICFAVLSSVFLHEMGHLSASLLFHKKPLAVRILPVGIGITLQKQDSYLREIAVAFAGPFMNFLYAAFAGFLPLSVGESVMEISLFLGIFNLLPITTLDGGQIVEAVFSFFFSPHISRAVLQVTSAVFLFILYVLSLYIFFMSGINMALLVFVTYLFSYLVIKKQQKACHPLRNMVK